MVEELHPDLLTRVLRRLDGVSLAAIGCVSSHLRLISSEPSIWRDLCLSTWPSLRHPRLMSLLAMSDHKRLFFSAFPLPTTFVPSQLSSDTLPLPRELISAVDLHHKGNLIFSRVVELDTSSSWFLGCPFRIDMSEEHSSSRSVCLNKEVINPFNLTLSWIVINPESRRAVNVSSRIPVAIDRHWYTGETLVRYGIILHGMLIVIVVTCGEDGGHVREVSMTIEDGDGIGICGKESLEVIMEAMQGSIKKWSWNGEDETDARNRYEEFVSKRRYRKESKARKECLIDFFCTGIGAVIFLVFLLSVFLR